MSSRILTPEEKKKSVTIHSSNRQVQGPVSCRMGIGFLGRKFGRSYQLGITILGRRWEIKGKHLVASVWRIINLTTRELS